MVKRVCVECNEVFHPYSSDDYVCDSCIEGLNTSECKVCGFDFKPDNLSVEVCSNCLFDLGLSDDFID